MKKILKAIGLLLCAVVLIAAAVVFVYPYAEAATVDASDGPAVPWMAEVPDSTPLSEITIPGTHDSATKAVQLPFFSMCQSETIARQLEDGFRYLDVRLGESDGGLIFYHGFCKCTAGIMPWSGVLTLEAVLDDCCSFLEENPSETILFVVKMEQGDDVASFQQLLDGCIAENPDKWLLTDAIPTLGDCRGKLVLFRRYEDAAGLGKTAGIPMLWTDQGGHAAVSLAAAEEPQDSYTLIVQDRYKYGTDDKWAAFLAGLDVSADTAVHLDFLSTNGTAAYGHPFSHGKALNGKLLGEDLSTYAGGRWIIVDFGTAALAEHIYGRQ